MSMKCYMVKDLLPNYIDKLTSEETNTDIKKHLEECEECNEIYTEMNNPNLDFISKEVNVEENIEEIKYLKKCNKKVKLIIAIAISAAVFIVILLVGLTSVVLKDCTEKVTDINQYEYVLGSSGKYKENFGWRNKIFPDKIPSSAKIEDFCYYYLNLFDPCYLGYLVYTCSDEEYQSEYNRLKEINSSQNYLIYGATGFPYELCAVYADSVYGYIYALTDKETNKFIYVELKYYNYFTNINYKEIINESYLPMGFDATSDNQVWLEIQKSLELKANK